MVTGVMGRVFLFTSFVNKGKEGRFSKMSTSRSESQDVKRLRHLHTQHRYPNRETSEILCRTKICLSSSVPVLK